MLDIFQSAMGEFLALICAVLWALGVVLLRKSGETVKPLDLNLYKNTVATVLFLLTLPLLGLGLTVPEATGQDWLILIISGILGLGLGDSLFLWGLTRIGAGRAAIAECFYGSFVAVASVFYLSEEFTWPLVAGLVFISTGVYLSSRDEEDRGGDFWWGFGACLLSVLLMAIGVVIAKPVLNKTHFLWATLVRLYGGTGFLIIFLALRSSRRESFSILKPGQHWRVLFPTAFIATYLAMMFLFAGLKYTSTISASLINQSSPFFVLIFAWLFLSESLSSQKIGAVVLGVLGTLCVLATRFS